jgi:hypothetical protein
MPKTPDLNVTAESIANQLEELAEVLTNLMILQLGLVGVPQRTIRTAVGVDLNRVTRILRGVKPKVEISDEHKKTKKRRGR